MSDCTLRVTDGLCGPRYHQTLRDEVKELGEIDMVPMAATLELVTHDGARRVFPAAHLEGQIVRSRGELARLVGGSGIGPASGSADQR